MNYFNSQIGFGTAGLADRQDSAWWNIGKKALHTAIEVGYTVFDTAEMYGDGKSETMIGEVLAETAKRNQLHIVTKILPKNATSKTSIIDSCCASIQRMNCDYIDTYLLHWREGNQPLQPIVEAFLELQQQGLIKKYGVSNFDTSRSLLEWASYERHIGTQEHIVANQVHYSLSKRAPEDKLIKLHETMNITMMAHSPLITASNKPRNNILNNNNFFKLAEKYNYNPAQLAIAWTVRNPGVIAIPRSIQPKHIEDNFTASKLVLDAGILAELDQLFPV